MQSSRTLLEQDHQDPFREHDAVVGFLCPHCRRVADQQGDPETPAGLLGVAVHVAMVSAPVLGEYSGAVLDRVRVDVDRWYWKAAVWHAHGGVGFDTQGVPLADYGDPDDTRFGVFPPFVKMRCGRRHPLAVRDRRWLLSRAQRARRQGHDTVCLPGDR